MRARPIESPGDRGTRRVAQFVAGHEGCGGQFDVIRQPGGGRGGVRIACAACGASADCDPSHPGLLRLAGEEGDAPRSRRPLVSAEELQRWLPAPAALPWWVPNAYIGVIIAVGLALVAFGLVAPIEREGPVVLAPPPQGTDDAPQEPPPPPEVNTGPVEAGALGVQPQAGGPESFATVPRWVKRRGRSLNRVQVADRFAIGVPSGWTGGTSDGAVVFYEPGRSAELRVFLEAGEAGLDELTRKARAYLADRRPGADILGPESLRLGDRPAEVLLARYDGGDDRAVLLRSGGYAFLLLGTVDGSASQGVENDALAALSSFRPL